MKAIVILCTAPDQTTAQQLAALALEARLAACVTLLPGATSWYRWQGKIEQSSEVQMLLKCDSDRQQALSCASVTQITILTQASTSTQSAS